MFAGKPPFLEGMLRFNARRGEYGPRDIEQQVSARIELAKEHKPHALERQRPDGITIEVRGAPVEGGGFVTTYIDVTERCRNEALIQHMAHHDTLTELPNRVLFHQRLGEELARITRGVFVPKSSIVAQSRCGAQHIVTKPEDSLLAILIAGRQGLHLSLDEDGAGHFDHARFHASPACAPASHCGRCCMPSST